FPSGKRLRHATTAWRPFLIIVRCSTESTYIALHIDGREPTGSEGLRSWSLQASSLPSLPATAPTRPIASGYANWNRSTTARCPTSAFRGPISTGWLARAERPKQVLPNLLTLENLSSIDLHWKCKVISWLKPREAA